jgi:hypothetical protein
MIFGETTNSRGTQAVKIKEEPDILELERYWA